MMRHAEPVFVLAPPRSYSTVVTAVLGGHPDIHAFPELVLFQYADVRGLFEAAEHPDPIQAAFRRANLVGLVRAVAWSHDRDQSPGALDAARRWIDEHADWTGAQMMRYLLDRVAPLVPVEKSPVTLGDSAAFARCREAFPNARLLHLTRHPVSAQQSLWEHWTLRHGHMAPTKRRVTNASVWYRSHLRAVRALDELPAHQWRRVQGEELLRAPEKVLPELLDWLGLDSDPGIVRGMLATERWTYASPTANRAHGGDPKFYAAPELRPIAEPGPVEFDPEWGLSDPTCRRMTLLAKYLGYDGARRLDADSVRGTLPDARLPEVPSECAQVPGWPPPAPGTGARTVGESYHAAL